MNVKDIHKFHRKMNRHHVKNNLKKTTNDLIETIIDWECARLTKPDKPLNAYDTLMKFYPDYKKYIYHLLLLFQLHLKRQKLYLILVYQIKDNQLNSGFK